MAWLDARYDRDAVLIVRVTAANLHGTAERVFSLAKEVKKFAPADLVDLSELRRLEPELRYSAALRFTRGERRQFSGFPQHLVHLGGVQFFRMNHLPSELLQSDEATLHHS